MSGESRLRPVSNGQASTVRALNLATAVTVQATLLLELLIIVPAVITVEVL